MLGSWGRSYNIKQCVGELGRSYNITQGVLESWGRSNNISRCVGELGAELQHKTVCWGAGGGAKTLQCVLGSWGCNMDLKQ